jgi:anti-anti-sigma regulatory factor
VVRTLCGSGSGLTAATDGAVGPGRFCDSSGLAALIAARSHAHGAQADIALAAVPPHTLRVLRIVGLDQIFPLHPDSHSATRS